MIEVSGAVVRIMLAVLCVGAAAFLLRVLAALVKEEMNTRPRTVQFYMAKFTPSGRRGELIVMNPESREREMPTRADQRMAL